MQSFDKSIEGKIEGTLTDAVDMEVPFIGRTDGLCTLFVLFLPKQTIIALRDLPIANTTVPTMTVPQFQLITITIAPILQLLITTVLQFLLTSTTIVLQYKPIAITIAAILSAIVTTVV